MFNDKLNEALTSRKSFFADPYNFIGLGISAVLNIIHWTILYYKIKPGNNTIVLHYNVIYGTDFVEKSLFIYWIPLLALMLLILNTILSIVFYNREKIASYFIDFSTIAVQAVFLVASIVLIIINS